MADNVRPPVQLRTAYRDMMRAYTRDIAQMAEMARVGMLHASRAITAQDLEAAESAMSESDAIAEIHRRCEERALALLALENPVATELRQILAYLTIDLSLMRMSALAKSVAKIARQHHPSPALPAETIEQVKQMAQHADTMAAQVCAALREPAEGLSLDSVDDAIDTFATHLTSAAKSEAWQHSSCHAVETALVARYYERFADHCVDIARQLTFIATGERPTTD